MANVLSAAYAFGRRTQQTHDGAMPVSYAYDAASRLTKLTHPDGFAVDYAYDAADAVISAVNGPNTIATVAYDALGRRSALTYGNGAVATYGYDAASRLDALDWDVAGSADDIAYGFSYNPASQTRTKNVAPAVMLWTPPSNATDTYAVNGLNQYTDVKGNAIVHDGCGNITTDHRGRTQTYDIDNRLLTVAGLSGGTASYAYTAAGNLHEKSYSGVASKFYYDDSQEIFETDGVGVKLRRYLRLPGGIDEPLLMIDYTLNGACTNTSYASCEVWAHQNRQGSIVATTNSTGAKLDLYTYSPYGESGTEGASGFPFRYTGQKLDPDTGLYYYKARWYDPEPGRFMQTDPIGYEDQMNLYGYVGNDPVNFFDPFGRRAYVVSRRIFTTAEAAAAGAAAYAAAGGGAVGAIAAQAAYRATRNIRHEFLVVTEGDLTLQEATADQTTVYSYGPENDGRSTNPGNTQRKGPGSATHEGDLNTLDNVRSGNGGDTTYSEIVGASNEDAKRVFGAEIELRPYFIIPLLVPGSTNSNSVGTAKGQALAATAGSTYKAPRGIHPGASQADRVVCPDGQGGDVC